MAEYHELDPNGDVVLVLRKGDAEGKCQDDDEAIRIRVSSRHLTLASSVFAAMLRPDSFREGAELRSSGAVKIELHDDAAPALLTALTVVHAQLSRVPRSMALAEVADIALVVDKYGLHDTLCLHGDMWLDKLAQQNPLPSSASADEFMPWLCAAWVFRRQDEFRALTQVAQQQWDGPLGTGAQPAARGGFPVPLSILDAIEEARKRAISRMLAHVMKIFDNYQGPAQHCPDEDNGLMCDAMLLGRLLRELKSQRLYPLPSTPFHGLSFSDLATRLGKMCLMSMCEEFGSRKPKYVFDTDPQCGIKKEIDGALAKRRAKLSGLDLPAST